MLRLNRSQRPLLARRNSGFTFIELLAVLVILALVLGVATPAIFNQIKKGKINAAKVEIETIGQALNAFNLDCGYFPTTEQGIQALITAPSAGKICKSFDPDGYLKKKVLPKDPWQEPYIYTSPGQHNTSSYDLSSAGPDKAPGTDDDIKSWE